MIKKVKKIIQPKKSEIVRGYTIKYHANGKTIWSKGKIKNAKPDGYWEWYRIDGTLKRSGNFKEGNTVGEWTTYDIAGKVYKVTRKQMEKICSRGHVFTKSKDFPTCPLCWPGRYNNKYDVIK